MRKSLKSYFPATIIFLIIISSGCREKHTQRVCFRNTCVFAEVADSSLKRQKGLMFKNTLDAYQGMLFVYPQETRPAFWMKHMAFPLDIIWISKEKEVLDITEGALPCNDGCVKLIPREKVKYALEVNAGFVAKWGIKLKDQVAF